MPDTEKRLAAIEKDTAVIKSKQEAMIETINFIKKKHSNGLITDVAILKLEAEERKEQFEEHKASDKWLKRLVVGAAISILVADIISAIL